MDIVEALEPFDVHLPDGRPFVVARGDKFLAGDPILKGREHLFGPLQLRSSLPAAAPSSPARASETASAAPGERRARTKPAAAPAAPKEV